MPGMTLLPPVPFVVQACSSGEDVPQTPSNAPSLFGCSSLLCCAFFGGECVIRPWEAIHMEFEITSEKPPTVARAERAVALAMKHCGVSALQTGARMPAPATN